MPRPLSAGMLGTSYRLPDGYAMIWDRPAAITATTPYVFHFRLVGTGWEAGHGHAALSRDGGACGVREDGWDGLRAYASGRVRRRWRRWIWPMPGVTAAGWPGCTRRWGRRLGFPYGFPSAGKYRIFVQMKHGETVETGVVRRPGSVTAQKRPVRHRIETIQAVGC